VTNTGTLAFHDQTTAGAATIANSGALTFADASTAGTASITNSTAGAISFAGSADATTASIANSGSIDLSAMQGTLSIGSLNGSGTVALGSNDLTLGSLGHSDTFTGVISGTGGLNKTGAGTLTLSGANLYSGTTSVLAGSIDLSGTLASPIVVANQAVLTGAGSTASNVQVSTGGSFQPGNGFHVGGNLTLSPQSQFVVAVTPTGPASSAIVAGTASIGSSNLNIQAGGAATSYVPRPTTPSCRRHKVSTALSRRSRSICRSSRPACTTRPMMSPCPSRNYLSLAVALALVSTA
jgi:autotransporter-associated beta strand protein